MSNLLPENITEDLANAPVTILEAYADQIGQELSNKIIAEVHPRNYTTIVDVSQSIKPFDQVKPKLGPKLYFAFEIVAPPLNNYRYELFLISYDMPMYPAQLYLDEDILQEIVPEQSNERYGPLEIGNPNEMKSILDHIFKAQKTIAIIRSLLSQINGHYQNGANN